MFMSVLALRLLLKAWNRGGINLVQTDIYYDINSNIDPQYIFKDGLEIAMVGESVEGYGNFAKITKAISFSPKILEATYDEVTKNMTYNTYYLSWTECEWNSYSQVTKNLTEIVLPFCFKNKTQYVQGYSGSVVDRELSISLYYNN